MRPHERHRSTSRVSVPEIAFGNIRGIPHLFRQQPRAIRLSDHDASELPRTIAVTGGDLVVRPLAGQQRPSASDAGAVIAAAVLMLAILVADKPMPHR